MKNLFLIGIQVLSAVSAAAIEPRPHHLTPRLTISAQAAASPDPLKPAYFLTSVTPLTDQELENVLPRIWLNCLACQLIDQGHTCFKTMSR